VQQNDRSSEAASASLVKPAVPVGVAVGSADPTSQLCPLEYERGRWARAFGRDPTRLFRAYSMPILTLRLVVLGDRSAC
jgi:hypothetical protein